jgi:phosphate transport system permease protein
MKISEKNIRRARRIDRIATVFITAGGVVIICSVVLILLLIMREAWPLFTAARATSTASQEANPATLAVGLDEYLQVTALIGEDGTVRFQRVEDGAAAGSARVTPPTESAERIAAVSNSGSHEFTLRWNDDSASLASFRAVPRYERGHERDFDYRFETRAEFPPPAVDGAAIAETHAREGAGGRLTRADRLADGRVMLSVVAVEEDLFGNRTETVVSHQLEAPGAEGVGVIALNSAGTRLYAGTGNGHIHVWDLSAADNPRLTDDIRAFEDGRAITALSLVLGDISLAVGDDTGLLSTWTPVRPFPEADQRRLARIHTLAQHDAPIERILISMRNKSLLSISGNGELHLTHMTSNRDLLSLHSPQGVKGAAFAARANGVAVLDDANEVLIWGIDNPHPEVSFGTLFGKVQYENYDEPAFVWQSTGGTDAVEPKLSLMPLIFGSFKGTFYAMLYAVPLALFGAIYTSQFTRPRVRGLIKTTVELMAAVPTVVIGFLIALWLAPIVERNVVGMLLSVGLIPLIFFGFVLALQPLRRHNAVKRLERGYEFVVMVPVVLVACWLAFLLGPVVEHIFFGGEFQQWLFRETGERYDQRNAIIIAFGLGFAVIPIIFSISEDALSNVPNSLKAASMAVGASRWQTVWRVVLPAASPGIFAGGMIGFGRAVGETMIVLMATGNTPIMDWSIFNGMRTLSANIAVEIAEAPVGGTLYRVLFLSAVILFLITFMVNTSAELVRQYLRKKYAQFH